MERNNKKNKHLGYILNNFKHIKFLHLSTD
jgi:hypothetical protein